MVVWLTRQWLVLKPFERLSRTPDKSRLSSEALISLILNDRNFSHSFDLSSKRWLTTTGRPQNVGSIGVLYSVSLLNTISVMIAIQTTIIPTKEQKNCCHSLTRVDINPIDSSKQKQRKDYRSNQRLKRFDANDCDFSSLSLTQSFSLSLEFIS